MTLLERSLAAGLSVLLLGGSATVLCAQSLADVAKKEEERRKEVKQPSKTYTNKDLTAVPPVTTPPAAEAATPAAPAPAADAAPARAAEKPDAAAGKGKETVKDQAYWSGRMKDLQTQLDQNQSYADAMQNKINSLTADFTARDDPAQRAVIARDRQKALDDLTRLKQATVDGKKKIADLEEEARRAGVPPGWLR